MRRRQQAFTLVEVMIVVAILGIVVVLAAPNFSSMLRAQGLKSEARQLAAAFVEAQGWATSSGAQARLFIDRGNGSWRVEVDRDNDNTFEERKAEHSLRDPLLRFGPEAGISGPFAAPYAAVAHDSWCTVCSGNSGAIVFGPEGTVTNAASGAVMLHNSVTAGAIYALAFFGPTGNFKLMKVSP